MTDWLYWRMKKAFPKWSVKQQREGYTRYMELRLHVGVVNALWVQMGKRVRLRTAGVAGFRQGSQRAGTWLKSFDAPGETQLRTLLIGKSSAA